MTSALRKAIFSTASKVLQTSSKNSGIQRCRNAVLMSSFAKTCKPWGLSRSWSVWSLCTRPSRNWPVTSLATNNTCASRGIHTEGDQELLKFLDKEIKLEKESLKFKTELPELPGWEGTLNDAEVKFVKQTGDEKMTVTFNINFSVDADEPPTVTDTAKDAEEEVAHMISRPPFLVEISKKSGRTISVNCSFPPFDEDLGEGPTKSGEEEVFMDQFEIDELAIHDGNMKEHVFRVGSDTMDGNLYDLIMDMLDERGISDEFISKMVDFSTTYEHGKYVTFLQDLKTFVEE